MGDVFMGLTSVGVHGDLSLIVLGPDGRERDRRDGPNVMCTVGLSALAEALVWAGIEDQAGNLGITSPTYLTPLYGAVGSGTGTVSPGDVALFAELGRQPVGAGASTPATPTVNALCTWLFYFPSPASTWTVTEAGVFTGASASAGSGSMLDHWSFSPTLTVTPSDSLILQAAFSVGDGS